MRAENGHMGVRFSCMRRVASGPPVGSAGRRSGGGGVLVGFVIFVLC